MTKIDIFSGFLGAGKTTLIRKLIKEAYAGEKIVLIENEFGEIAIDGGFLKDAGVEITEMNSGCICCTLVGDFKAALEKVIDDYAPDRVIIEPSGVGKLSDVAKAVAAVEGKAQMGAKITVVDAGKCKMYIRNFGEFFNDQVQNADVIVLSRTQGQPENKLITAVALLQGQNPRATIITTDWDKLSGRQFMEAMEGASSVKTELEHMAHHHGHHHADGEACTCGCDHDEHEHHHDHHHDHEHHHHADESFSSVGWETPRMYSQPELEAMLEELQNEEKYGAVLRAKGMLPASDGQWLYFDYVPGEASIRRGAPIVTGRLCVIGAKIHEGAIKELFKFE